MTELLDSIFQIGEKMRITLSQNDLASFHSLLGERQRVIKQLSEISEKKSTSPEFSEKFSRLEEQFQLIMSDLKLKEQSMAGELQKLQNIKQAQRSYSFDRQPYRFLRNNVSG